VHKLEANPTVCKYRL